MIWLIEMDSAAECAGETQGQSFKIPAKCHISRSYAFLVRMFGSKGEKRSFRTEWCAKYHWLHCHKSCIRGRLFRKPATYRTIHATRQPSGLSGKSMAT